MAQTTARPRLSRAYWRLWWAAGVDNVGDGAFAAAVPLLAVTVTRDPRLVSVVAAATYLPWLLLSLPVGALVDRRDRVGLMWRSQAVQGVIVAVIAVLAAFGLVGVPVLAVAAFGLGAGEVVFANAAQAVLPDMVPKPLLHKANGHQQVIVTVGQQFVGPPVGSLLFAIAVALPFGLDAGSFALSAALLATLPRRQRVERPRARGQIAAGLRWLVGHRLLRTLALVLGVNTFCGQLGNATLVLLATGTLGLDARGYGVLLGGAAVGSVVGGVVNARVVARIGEIPALVVSLAANALVFVAIGLSPNAVVLGVSLAVNGFVTTLWNIVTVSLRQEIVPADMLGRVNSVYRMLGWGLIPVGAVVGGFVAHAWGLRAPFPVAGGLRAIALVAALPVLLGSARVRVRSGTP
jgi:MFS family permease